MKKKLIPDNIMQEFQKNPQIGRIELAKVVSIPESEARFYCRLYKEMTSGIKYKARGIALFDIHYPDHNRAVINVVMEFIKDFKPDYLVFGGDQLNLDCISHHNKGKVKLLENRRLSKDYKGFQTDILDRVDSILPKRCKKYMLEGNHEFWVRRLIEDNPQMEGLVEVENNLDLSSYKIIPFNEMLKIGEMSFTHGIYTNKYHAEKHLRIFEKMLFYGHLHTNQVYTAIAPLTALPKQAISVGCLCNRNAEYLRNRPNAWVHSFLFWYMLSDGSFTYFTPIIVNGRCIINNKLYDGNKE